VGGQSGRESGWGGGSGRDSRAEYSTTFQNTPEHSGAAAAATTSAINKRLHNNTNFYPEHVLKNEN